MPKATTIFKPGDSNKNTALGGSGGLNVASYTNGIPGGPNAAGRKFKIGQMVTKFQTKGYPK